VQGIDNLARKRCQCLLAVDDSYAGIIDHVEKLGELDKTYVLITSDHGKVDSAHLLVIKSPTN
jgi:arylsulfatase A-like enzyme